MIVASGSLHRIYRAFGYPFWRIMCNSDLN
nr:MAG TPA: Eyes absent-like protein [Bacteriophage sp.]